MTATTVLPCGHTEEQADALKGKPWEDRGGWSPMCRVCWRWSNEPYVRAAWSGQHQPAAVRAVPRDQWPVRIKLMAWSRRPEDKGVGDTVARKLGVVGEAWKAIYHWLTGEDCGCADRQRKLNLMYPYEPEKTA